MKLVIQIPCHNEESTLPRVLAGLPGSIPGVDEIQVLVINDGSTDRTAEVAAASGADHVLNFAVQRGLAKAFGAGLEFAVQQGADIIVNTDGDNQYDGADIPLLVAPVLSGEADMTVGARPIAELRHFSPAKKFLQRFGSAMIRWISGTPVADAPSGFRAISREAAMRLESIDEYTYTLDTLLQAGEKGLAVKSVAVRANEALRPSRLVKSVPGYVFRSIKTVARIGITYRPLRFFFFLGTLFLVPGLVLCGRYLYFFVNGQGAGHVQSVLLAVLLIGCAFGLWLTGIATDLIATNRLLLERLNYRVLRLEELLRNKKSVG